MIFFGKKKEKAKKANTANTANTEEMPSTGECSVIRASVDGKVVQVVSLGQKVKCGDVVLVIYVMGMYVPVVTEVDGVVSNVYVRSGDVVHQRIPVVTVN